MKFIKDFVLDELRQEILRFGVDAYRANQIFHYIYKIRVSNFDEINVLPKKLRDLLKEFFYLEGLEFITQEKSNDGTIKYLFRLKDGSAIESVFIPADNGLKERKTLCVSSQVGCALNCTFCATGKIGLKRNLTAGEIIDQILFVERLIGYRLTNIVFMGMGEPLQNFGNVVKAIQVLTDSRWNMFSRHNITVSTSGIVPKIYELAEIKNPVKLAISLHTTDNNLRKKLMPNVANKWNLEELRDSAVFYYRKTRIPITYEYILFDGLNDNDLEIARLARLARAVPSKVNLIPFHPIDFVELEGLAKELTPPSYQALETFKNKLAKLGVRSFIRSSAGIDIKGACGQLALVSLRKLNAG
ncbi:MAG: 23S rRNA (adenine(2503)-C(2))-methyltransferase RlmN [Ignavibacteria bacterium]|nr:23S rRNA (adenine(2503)-C(2))-methyltransferase RlmN [Ignavibacteria bacterium]